MLGVGAFPILFGFKLWLIERCTGPVPFRDAYDGEGANPTPGVAMMLSVLMRRSRNPALASTNDAA